MRYQIYCLATIYGVVVGLINPLFFLFFGFFSSPILAAIILYIIPSTVVLILIPLLYMKLVISTKESLGFVAACVLGTCFFGFFTYLTLLETFELTYLYIAILGPFLSSYIVLGKFFSAFAYGETKGETREVLQKFLEKRRYIPIIPFTLHFNCYYCAFGYS